MPLNSNSANNIPCFADEFDGFARNIKQDLLKCIDSHLNTFKNQIEVIIAKINDQGDEIVRLSERIDYLEAEHRSCDIVITQVPVLTNEVVADVVTKISTSINFNCNDHSFSAFRTKSKTSMSTGKTSSSSSAPPIIIKFALKASAIEFFNQYKVKQSLSLKDIGMNASTRIYINRGLTTKTNLLFGEAKKIYKSGGIYKTFIKSGVVYILKTKTSVPTSVSCIQQLRNMVDNEYYTHPSTHLSSANIPVTAMLLESDDVITNTNQRGYTTRSKTSSTTST